MNGKAYNTLAMLTLAMVHDTMITVNPSTFEENNRESFKNIFFNKKLRVITG